jgi:hypothetical protein
MLNQSAMDLPADLDEFPDVGGRCVGPSSFHDQGIYNGI